MLTLESDVLKEIARHVNASPAFPPLSNVLRTTYRYILNGTFARHAGASLAIIVYGIGFFARF